MRFSSVKKVAAHLKRRGTVRRVAGILAGVAGVSGGMGITAAHAQGTESLPGTNNAAKPVTPNASDAAAAQMGALLGGGEFLNVIDRPFESEKLYKIALSIDPNNEAAKAGLKRTKFLERPTYTLLGHTYRNSFTATLATYGVDVAFRTPYGRIQVLAGTGTFKDHFGGATFNQPESLRKSTASVILEPYYKKWEGYLYYGGTYYSNDSAAKDRYLYDLRISYLPQQTRERITLISGRRDSFLQSSQAQFFAPETVPFVKSNLFLYENGIATEIPLGQKVDFLPAYSRLRYSDGNHRDIAHVPLLYRVLPAGKSPLPIFRVGFQYDYDGTDHPAGIYYSPVAFHSYSVAANYVMLSRKWRYGVFGTVPLTGHNGSGANAAGGGKDPYAQGRTFFTFVNYSPSDKIELWLKLTDVKSPNGSPSLTDYVQGITFRF